MGEFLDALIIDGIGNTFSESYWRAIERRHNRMFGSSSKDNSRETGRDLSYEEVKAMMRDVEKGTILDPDVSGSECLRMMSMVSCDAEDSKDHSEGYGKRESERSALVDKVKGGVIIEELDENAIDEMEEEAIRKAIEEKSGW